MKEKITVIIPTYKRAALLIRCLRAIAAQNLSKADFEVIVVSDGPDKETEKVLLPWQRKSKINLTFLQMPEKKGPAAARNLGWLTAKAPLVAFTDDDCIPHKEWLSAFLSHFSGEDFLAFTGKTQVPLPEKKTDFALNIAQLETADFITANCACTKQALMQVGGFDERFKMAWREDSDLQFKLLTHKVNIIAVAEAKVVHPVREVPWGISIKEQKKGIYDALLFKKYPQLYRRNIHAPIWNYYLILLFLFLVMISIHSNNYLHTIASFGLLIMFIWLINKRLKNRHKSLSHVTEMITTSLIIPFVSVFWRIYGSVKYRVLFL